MTMRALILGWAMLIGFSTVSTFVSILPVPSQWHAASGAIVLLLAWLKARVILSRYLGLCAAPFWARGFGLALGVFCTVLLGLYLIPFMF